MQPVTGYLRAVRLVRDSVPDFTVYPFSIPSIHSLDELVASRSLVLTVTSVKADGFDAVVI